MTSLMPLPVAGDVVPGTNAPFIKVRKPWGWQTYQLQPGRITTTPYGPAIKPEPKSAPAPAQQPAGVPKKMGDAQHHVLHALSALISQNATQMTDAMPSDRLWR